MMRLLVALDDYRNVGKVAASSNITQPAVSKALAELERSLGLKLFERSIKGLQPTPYGECLIRHSRGVLTQFAHAQKELAELADGEVRRVSVGVGGHASVELLPRAMALLKSRIPDTAIHVREDAMRLLLPDLWSGDLDLIVGRLPRARYPGLAQRTLTDRTITLTVRAQHPLARYKRLRWSQLEPYPWLLPPVGTPLRAPVERALELNHLPIAANAIETLSVNIICNYLAMSDAIAVLASQVSGHYQRTGLLHILPLELPQVASPGGVIWNLQKPLSRPAQLMIDCLEQVSAAHPDAGDLS